MSVIFIAKRVLFKNRLVTTFDNKYQYTFDDINYIFNFNHNKNVLKINVDAFQNNQKIFKIQNLTTLNKYKNVEKYKWNLIYSTIKNIKNESENYDIKTQTKITIDNNYIKTNNFSFPFYENMEIFKNTVEKTINLF